MHDCKLPCLSHAPPLPLPRLTPPRYCINWSKLFSRLEAYFHVVQRHLPLLSKNVFYRTLQQFPDKHQILALKYAVCMAGAQAERDAFQFRERCYAAARYHLEQAELGSGASSFWNIEAAQALVLVARFEFEHFASPRAMITTSRLFALMSVLCHQDISGSEKEQSEDEEEPNLLRMVMLVSLSMKFRETGVLGNSKFKVSHYEVPQPSSP